MYVKLQEYLLFIFWQLKLIEDVWFSFYKFITLILSARSAVKISFFKTTTPPKVETVENQFFQDHHTLPK